MERRKSIALLYVEDVLYSYFLSKQEKHVTITDDILSEVALRFYNHLPEDIRNTKPMIFSYNRVENLSTYTELNHGRDMKKYHVLMFPIIRLSLLML